MMMGAVACLMLFVTAQPAAAVVYTYDFDSLNTGPINGQDNWGAWPTGLLSVYTAPVDGAPHPGSGNLLSMYGGITDGFSWRVNDANWSFDISEGDQFAMGMSIATDYAVGGYYGFGKFLLGPNGQPKIGFGLNVEQWYYGVCIWDAQGTKHVGTQPRPTGKSQVWDYRMEVDLLANGGEGSASLYTMKRDVHTEWQPVGNLQGINLMLATAGVDMHDADKMYAQIDVRLVAMDNLWIDDMQAVVIPEPSGLGLVGIVLLAMRRRRT